MKKFIVLITLVFIQMIAFGQAPIVTSPTQGQIYYQGETVQIRWTGHANYGGVAIELRNGLKTVKWIAFSTPNDGVYDWVPDVTGDFTLRIAEGSDTLINISIRGGTRPSTPTPPVAKAPQAVRIKIRHVVFVSWTAIPGHTYRIEQSSDLKNWTKAADDAVVTDTEVGLPVWAEELLSYYRVYDLTP